MGAKRKNVNGYLSLFDRLCRELDLHCKGYCSAMVVMCLAGWVLGWDKKPGRRTVQAYIKDNGIAYEPSDVSAVNRVVWTILCERFDKAGRRKAKVATKAA